jgi:hypothetical protein
MEAAKTVEDRSGGRGAGMSGPGGSALRSALQEAVLAAPLDAVVPVWRSLSSDTETPVSAYLKLRRGGTGFLLESGEHDGRLGRFSFVGSSPDALLRGDLDRGTVATEGGVTAYRGSPIDAVRRLAGEASVWRGGGPLGGAKPDLYSWGVGAVGLPGFLGGLVGAFGYDLSRTLERLPSDIPDDTGFPAALFARYQTVLAFDHARQRMTAVSLLPAAADVPSRLESLRRAEGRIEGVLDALRRGRAPAALEPGGGGGRSGAAMRLRAQRCRESRGGLSLSRSVGFRRGHRRTQDAGLGA